MAGSSTKAFTKLPVVGLAASIATALYPESQSNHRTAGLALLEDIPITVELYDEQGFQVYVNAAWETLWEMPRSVCKGYNLLKDPNLPHGPSWSAIQSAFAGTPARSSPIFYSPQEHGLPGRDRWVEVFVCPLKRFSPEANGILLIQIDVTDHLQGRHEITRLEKRLSQLKDENLRLHARVQALEVTPPLLETNTDHALRERFADFSERESQVFQQLATGLSVKQIAYAMNLSVKSVYTYRSRLLRKLGVNNDVALARLAAGRIHS